MNLTYLRRSTAAAAVVALSLTAAACSSEDDAATDGETTSEAPATSDAPESDDAETGSGDISEQVFGEACGQLPQGDEDGSLDSMVVDPVATAAGTNPLLTTLTAAVEAAGLGDTLNGLPAATVFAPFDGAGGQVPLAGLLRVIEGDESGMTVSDGTTTANVLCGNIPTANATVYVIDQVLLGGAPS